MTSRFWAADLPRECLARQLQMEAPALRVAGRREAPASGSRGGVQGRRVERRDRRALFSEAARGSSRTCAAAQLEKLGLRYFFTHGDNRDLAAARRARSRRRSHRCPRFSSIAGDSRTICSRTERRARRRRCSTAAASGTIDARRRPASIRCRSSTQATARHAGHRAMGRRCERPGRPAQAPARPRSRPSTHGANAAWWRVSSRA